jgi:hypothetical protein
LDEAVSWSKELLKIFEEANVKVIRMGLHPSEGLLSGDELVAGPFHPSFRELVLTEIWHELLKPLIEKKGQHVEVSVAPNQLNYAIGYKGKNRFFLQKYFKNVKFYPNDHIYGRNYFSET